MRLKLFLPCICILATALCAHAQQDVAAPALTNQESGICPPDAPEKQSIQGRIIAPGATWDRYTEVLQLNEAQLIGFGYTNGTGEFKLPEQVPGKYNLVVRIDGFKEYRDRIDVFSCNGLYPYTIFMETEDDPIRPLILDFTGEVKEVVDVAELKRILPKKAVDEFERAGMNVFAEKTNLRAGALEALLKTVPDFYDARNVLGSIHLQAKRFREAEAQYNKARELRPNSAAPLVSLGSLYVQEAEASLHPEPGISGTVVPGEDLGLILDDARSILELAIKVKPDAPFAYYLLGVAQMRNNSYARAVENLRKALDIEGQLRWARIALANVYIRQNKWHEAVAEFDAYLEQFKKVSNRDEVQETRKKIVAQLQVSK